METKGDGTDLCCRVNPIRRCQTCRLTLCYNHWWNSERQRLGLRDIDVVYGNNQRVGICPICRAATITPEGEWSKTTWEIPPGVMDQRPGGFW